MILHEAGMMNYKALYTEEDQFKHHLKYNKCGRLK